ncbi:CRACD-like protein [Eublepharis macularius]|uniref:CRACD-like protein n=1 Tax=Eublepharis macularius TaxID=481883 RepID=A0AA97J1N0_EUBMA|nr:CRACD-like protein [Eublepharis macularius]XP_054829466.1 CRACD-like protein [Eublepharis macularius]
MSCTRTMDTRLQEAEGFGDESSGKKKSKFKSIKKFFGKRKRKETLPSSGSGSLKLYQSTSDVTTSESMHIGYDSEDEPEIHNSIMGSRALSHDSIFISEAAQEPARPVRVFSQENVSGRIRALQLKLQQNWKFGRTSPFATPSKRMDDAGMSSEDDGLPRSPPEMSLLQEILNSKTVQFSDSHKHLSSLSLAGTGSEEEEQVTSSPWRPCFAESQLFPRKSSVKIIAVSTSEGSLSPPADFDTPPEFTAVLDNSAAKHKLLVKPRNQRSSKMRRPPSKSLSESQNDLSSTPEEDECERKEVLAELTYESVSSSCLTTTESTASSNDATYSQQLEMSKGLQPSLNHQDENSPMLHSASQLDLSLCEYNLEDCQTSQGFSHTRPSLPSSEQKENVATFCLTPELETQRDKECYESEKICQGNLSGKHISDVPSKSGLLCDMSTLTKNDVLSTLDGTRKNIDEEAPALVEDVSNTVSSSLANSPALLPKSHFQLRDAASPENNSYSQSPCTAPTSQKGIPSSWTLDKMKPTQEFLASEKENNSPVAPGILILGGKTEKAASELSALKKFSVSSSRERLRTSSLSRKENSECENPINIQVLQTKIKSSSRDEKLKEPETFQEKKSSTNTQTPPPPYEWESTGKGLDNVMLESLPQAINPTSVLSNSGSGLPQQSSASQTGCEDKNPFQVKLRSTSLSLRYRDSSSRESKETKRYSAEFNLEKEELPSTLIKSEKGEVRNTTNINIGNTLNETCKTKTKSPEPCRAKPPLPRKPILQNLVITGTNTSTEKQEKAIKCPESKNEEKDLDKKTGPSEVPEKSVPSPVSAVDAARGMESQMIPAWITIAKQKQRIMEQELSREEKPVAYDKAGAEKQKREMERMEEAIKQQTDLTQRAFLPMPSTVHSEEETKEAKSDTQEMLPRVSLLSHHSSVQYSVLLEKEDTKLVKKVTHSSSDQPSWMELAKKKSQAWSDMPQMIK